MVEENIDFKNIKNKIELKKILDSLYEQGFGYHNDDDFHNNKVGHIISKANKFNVDYRNFYGENKIPDFYKLTNYDDIKKQAESYFSKFSSNDKIDELLDTFYLQENDKCQTPWRSISKISDIIDWVNFRKKYNIDDIFGTSDYVLFYNLDKNILKIRFPEYKGYMFDNLYELIFNEKPDKYDEPRFGKLNKSWQNLGKIEIKFYQNNNADIKGDLTKIKEYFFKKITLKHSYNLIIKFNGNQTIINKKDQT